jgi:predicted Zn-dependent protease
LWLLALLPVLTLPPDRLPTTDGRIAVGNLDAQIAGLSRAGHQQELVGAYLTRAQYLGAPGDYDQAEELAGELVRRSPREPEPYLLRAQVRAALHQFGGALADARQAEKLGARKEALEALRAGVWQAMGDEEKALPFRENQARVRPDIESLGQLAVLEGQRGRIDEAERLFARAQDSYRDVSPFPLSWLYFQWGLLNERAGRISAARELYQAAHDRLPEHAPATGHLAGALAATGDKEQAIQLLSPLAERLEDPEYAAQLLQLRPDEKLRARTAQRYDELLRKHPEAFADHAARFYAGQPRALELARKNLANRHTDEAWQLYIESLLAVKHGACFAADEAVRQRTRPGAGLRVVVAKAWVGCGKMSQAEKLLTNTAPSPPPATPRR